MFAIEIHVVSRILFLRFFEGQFFGEHNFCMSTILGRHSYYSRLRYALDLAVMLKLPWKFEREFFVHFIGAICCDGAVTFCLAYC